MYNYAIGQPTFEDCLWLPSAIVHVYSQHATCFHSPTCKHARGDHDPIYEHVILSLMHAPFFSQIRQDCRMKNLKRYMTFFVNMQGAGKKLVRVSALSMKNCTPFNASLYCIVEHPLLGWTKCLLTGVSGVLGIPGAARNVLT